MPSEIGRDEKSTFFSNIPVLTEVDKQIAQWKQVSKVNNHVVKE